MDKFYMVLNLSTSYTNYQHDSKENAKKEAERLAIQNPGKRFAVLECIGVVIKNEVVWSFPDSELPF